MAKNDKITASDIFDENIGIAYKNFINLNKEAAEAIANLKRQIRYLNNVIRANKAAAGAQKSVNNAVNGYSEALAKVRPQQQFFYQQTKKNTQGALQLASAWWKVEKQVQKTGVQMKKTGGTLGKVGKILRSLAGAAGFAGLAFAIIQFGRAVYDTAKQLESMELALSKVTSGTYEFGQAQSFLVKTSDRLGISLLKTAKRYNTFRAAARQANFTQRETNDIFETFADVGANLALSADEMGGIFLALEQMMSKGKVSTEELRRQLGERLPGAFGLMADAVGVTTGELDDMLRKGLVPTAEYLPKFTKVVAEYYNVDLSKRVDTLAAAQTRLGNAFTLFVDEIAGSGTVINGFFKTVLDGLSMAIEKVTEIIEIVGFLMDQKPEEDGFWYQFWKWGDEIEAWAKPVTDFLEEVIRLTIPFGEFFKEGGQYDTAKADLKAAKALERRGTAMAELASVVGTFEKQVLGQDKGTSAYGQNVMMQALGYGPEELDELIEFIKKATLDTLDAEEKARAALEKARKDAAEKRQKEIDAYRKANGGLLPAEQMARRENSEFGFPAELMPETEGLNLFEDGWVSLIKKIQTEIGSLEGEASKLREHLLLYPDDETAKEELKKIEDQILAFNKRIAQISEGGNIGLITEFTPPGGTPVADTPTETELNRQGTIFGKLDDKEAWIARLELAQDIASEIWEIEEGLHQRRLQRLEEEREASAKKYEDLYRLAEGDADQTARLKIKEAEEIAKFDAKERQLEKEKAKRKKRQALIDIALNTAVALVGLWVKPGFPAAIPAAVAFGAIALAQTAAVLALPEYAEGTDFHEGGPAIVGDGGKREIIVSPDGSMQLTDDKPQLVNMDRGSKVIADAQQFINEQVIKSIIDTNERMDQMIVEKITEAVQKGFKGVNINNNVTLRGSADFHAYRHNLLN